MFRPPYLWRRAPLKNLRHCWWDLRNGLKNVRRWVPVIWFDNNWDWDCLAEVMEFKLRAMAADTEHWSSAGNNRRRKQMLVCAELIRRLRADEYVAESKNRFPDKEISGHYSWALERAQREQELMGRILGKYMRYWWD